MSHFNSHASSNDPSPETQGNVLHKALSYDLLTRRLLKSSEASIRSLSQLKPGYKVLDVGCGSGRLTMAAQNWVTPGGEAHGVDPSPEMIAVARRNADRLSLPIKYQTGVVEALPFPDGSFDVVMSRLVLHHLPGDLKARGLAEMRRVLKPGGLCLVIDFEPPRSPILRHLAGAILTHTMSQMDIREYLPLLEAAGFSEVETGPTSSKLLSYVRGRSPKS
jgi:ubiquinone/menaquinone biosynthesis C-methylase UbiE